MKIGMLSLWNAANGPSIHAELIGREWVKMGHGLTVFSATRHPDARKTLQKDEDFVIRHFSVDSVSPVTRASQFDPTPLIKKDYEIFVAQNVERLPCKQLLKIFPEIRKKAKVVMVVHEGRPSNDPLYYKFNWDAIVCFDKRYKEWLVKFFLEEITYIIPYPFSPLKLGNKLLARKKLNLPLDKKIIFSFGFRPEDCLTPIPALKEINYHYPLLYLIIANPESNTEILLNAKKKYNFINLEIKPIPIDELYTYLHASDVLLIHRESSKKYNAVISSSVCQTLGSGCPILFHDSNYVKTYGDEIIKYTDFNDMKKKIIQIFQGKSTLKEVKKFLEKNNSKKIAERFIELFKKL
jgi:hypothetical protein